jgi:hypothetical protein
MQHLRVGILIGCLMPMLDTLSAPASQETDKKTEQKTSPSKSIDVRLKVSVRGDGTIPPNNKAEISGQEPACGALNSNDATAIIDEHGDAFFTGVPVCKVTIKVNVKSYIPSRTTTDLATYKSPIMITLEPER